MTTSTHTFSGKAKWCKVYKPDEKYMKYSVDILLDMDQYKKFKDLKVKNNGKPDEGGMWVTLRRNQDEGPPMVVDASGNPMQESIGNDSHVTCKLFVESFVSKKYGNITRTRLDAVRVDKLVVYQPEGLGAARAADPEKAEQLKPAAEATAGPPGSTPRPKVLF